MVGILILVHQHIAELSLVILLHIFMFLKQLYRDVNDVVKIQSVVVLQLGLVPDISPCNVQRPQVTGGFRPIQHLLGRYHLVLLPADGT